MADKFSNTVVSQYSLSKCIMSNCDYRFYGHFGDELMLLLDTLPTLGRPFYPYICGIAEVINYTMA